MEGGVETRITRLFGLRVPILAGGMMWLSRAPFVAACGRAGGIGFLTPRSYESLADYEVGLSEALELANGAPVGVNLTLSNHSSNAAVADQLRIALALGVRCFETAGAQPGELLRAVKTAGGRVIHKCTQVRHALSAERDGADAISLVGMEAGGHPGTNPHPTHVLAADVLSTLKVPLATGGGIGHGAQILSALAAGAEGVVMGSRFLLADEIEVHPRYKARLVRAGIDDTITALARYGATWRVLANNTAAEVRRMEQEPATRYEDFGQRVQGRYGHDRAYREGVWEEGMLSCSAAIGLSDQTAPVSVIFASLMAEYATARDRLWALLEK